MSASVYAYLNTVTSETYIGSTADHIKRRYCHAFRGNPINEGKPCTGGKLYDSMRKYGIDNFAFIIISKHKTVSAARKREAQLISLMKPELNTIGMK